eukprot:m.476991 g.476991  ORF g.476991 m.476991 type:complete len:186 (+) comp42367_c0_seq1:742-1299(+)
MDSILAAMSGVFPALRRAVRENEQTDLQGDSTDVVGLTSIGDKRDIVAVLLELVYEICGIHLAFEYVAIPEPCTKEQTEEVISMIAQSAATFHFGLRVHIKGSKPGGLGHFVAVRGLWNVDKHQYVVVEGNCRHFHIDNKRSHVLCTDSIEEVVNFSISTLTGGCCIDNLTTVVDQEPRPDESEV